MDAPRLEEYGLTEQLVDEIRARENRQFEVFVRVTAGGAALLWLVFTVFVYSHSSPRAPLLGLVAAPLLAMAGAVIASLPLGLVTGLAVLLLFPRHPRAKALEEYEKATAHVRPCDVCVLARGDHRPREGVSFCSRCGAWLCPQCRVRYDLRAIAALRARARPQGD
jgi:hypothetical protein